jgi:hypothetical protein
LSRTRFRILAGVAALAGLVAIVFGLTRTLQTIAAIGAAFDGGLPGSIKPKADSESGEANIVPGTAVPLPLRPLRDTPAISEAPRTTEKPELVEDLKRLPMFADLIDKSEAELAGENRDPVWAPAMEAEILAEIAGKALGLELVDLQVDCRTNVCRLEMVFPKRLLSKDFGNVPVGTPWSGQQPVSFFLAALDLELRQPVPAGLDRYGNPVVIAYVPRSQKSESP